MDKEEKELLFKDLCARLPYGVICVTTSVYYDGDDNEIGKAQGRLVSINRHTAVFVDDRDDTTFAADFEDNGQIGFKLCLRPMSSMSSKEIRELRQWGSLCMTEKDVVEDVGVYGAIHSIPAIDWLNSHHFDYRGLIEKGLALEAPEGMYTKN